MLYNSMDDIDQYPPSYYDDEYHVFEDYDDEEEVDYDEWDSEDIPF